MSVKDRVLKIFEGNPIYEKTRLLYWRIRNKKQQNIIEANAKERRNGRLDEKYLKLKSLKDTHLGERCFIIATGPSLTIEDLEKLKGEQTFAMNSIKRLYSQTDWRATYYGVQDRDIYEAMQEVIESTIGEEEIVFAGDILERYFDLPDAFTVFPYDGEYHLYNGKLGVPNAKFSDDAYSIVYDGYSITYSLIEIAVYMGFKEIYLLGCDCSWKKGEKNHIVETGFFDKRCFSNPVRQRVAYQCALDYANEHGIKIYNATRGGELETFERVNLDDVLKG